MEKLCQAFENGKELVELSQASPHDISNVLKLYLRQVRCWWSRLLGGGRGEVARGTNFPETNLASPSHLWQEQFCMNWT